MANNLDTQASHVLTVEALSKNFSHLKAVNELSFEVSEGEIFGFLGPNGAGKSTSINMICGIIRPDRGRICFKGKDISTDQASFRFRTGLCPQNLVLWGRLTCLEQLTYLGEFYGIKRAEARDRALLLLEHLHLSEKKHCLASTLSGGMQRRLNILLALIHDPELIILDEPEAGLDPQSRVLVRDFIKNLARKKTVILTTHNMDEAERVCDRVAIIDHGTLLALGTADELKLQSGLGDVLEIPYPVSKGKAEVERQLKALALTVSFVNDHLIIRSENIIGSMIEIFGVLQSVGIPTDEIAMRKSGLEDTFIALTGRRLRE